MSWLALDIGGANIKVADGRGGARSYEFALWKMPDRLSARLEEILGGFPGCQRLVATMTGELADCYSSKREGVAAIIDGLVQAARGRELMVYLTDGSWSLPQAAKSQYRLAAASNWHALARYAVRFTRGRDALLIDVGSTTCDLIPLIGGRVTSQGKTDTQRLLCQELVYTGVERTPVCAIVPSLPYRQGCCPVARELFATSLDAYLLLGDVPEDEGRRSTADGRPATRAAAQVRLARCVCADGDEFDGDDAIRAAQAVADAQARSLAAAIDAAHHRHQALELAILSGHGEFLARRALERACRALPTHSLRDELGADVSRCASSHALAVLANETRS
jgi:probable H4MPT-linked C1 transfer pathway protein